MKKAIYAGTFNPIHNGHLSIIEKALKIVDKLYVVVANNPEKEQTPIQPRVEKVKEMIKNIQNVEVIALEKGLLAKKTEELGANILIRSARDNMDFNYELMLAKANKMFNKELETILIMPDEINIEIRSSLIPKE